MGGERKREGGREGGREERRKGEERKGDSLLSADEN